MIWHRPCWTLDGATTKRWGDNRTANREGAIRMMHMETMNIRMSTKKTELKVQLIHWVISEIATQVGWDYQRVKTAYGEIVDSSLSQKLPAKQVVRAVVASKRCGVNAWTVIEAAIERHYREKHRQP